MILLLHSLVRLLAFLLLVALALLGLALALSSIGSDTSAPSLPWSAEQVGLPKLSGTAGRFLATLEHPGGTAILSALAGLGAIVLGLALLVGVLVRRRERLVRLAKQPAGGAIQARRGALSQAARALTEQARGVSDAKIRVRPRRRAGGTIHVRADRPRTADAKAVERAIEEQLTTLTGPFKLKARVSSRRGGRGSRVQ